MITIFSSASSSRLQYVFDLVFHHILNWKYNLVQSEAEFKSINGPKFSYSSQPLDDEIFFYSTGLLFESSIVPKSIQVVSKDDRTAFFIHNVKGSEWVFDPFAMIFYLVSRYEEYHDSQTDVHGRYQASRSLAVRYRFIHKPLINILVNDLGALLSQKFPELIFKKQGFQFQPTFDIDYAWAFRNKGLVRTSAATLRDIAKGKLSNIKKRFNVLRGQLPDPFDHFDLITEMHGHTVQAPIFFFLVGSHGKYDKNISIQNSNFQELIKRVDQFHRIGIHPSYRANSNKKLIEKERDDLSHVTGKKITISRLHFIKLTLPDSYRTLEAIGIKDDYSMGYPEISGFRASISTPFPWYDLEQERTSELMIHPFQIMDVTLKDKLGHSPDSALHEIQELIETTKDAGGSFTTIWHNSSLDFSGEWAGWEDVYNGLLNLVSGKKYAEEE